MSVSVCEISFNVANLMTRLYLVLRTSYSGWSTCLRPRSANYIASWLFNVSVFLFFQCILMCVEAEMVARVISLASSQRSPLFWLVLLVALRIDDSEEGNA